MIPFAKICKNKENLKVVNNLNHVYKKILMCKKVNSKVYAFIKNFFFLLRYIINWIKEKKHMLSMLDYFYGR